MILPKTHPKFVCNCCLFVTSHKNDYNKHLLTAKHKTRVKNPKTELMLHHKSPKKNPFFTCGYCNKQYNTQSGLWKHNQICNNNFNSNNSNNSDNK
jgi:hypothetical protein